jgi:hypothetical protein
MSDIRPPARTSARDSDELLQDETETARRRYVEVDRSEVATDSSRSSRITVRGVLELVGFVAAPVAFLTALGFYFGVMMTAARYSYFGIDNSVLHFSTQDYLLRAVDALFVPLGAFAIVSLVALMSHRFISELLKRKSFLREIRWAARVMAVCSLLLFMAAAYAVFYQLPFETHYLFAPISLGIGISGLAYSEHLEHRTRDRGQDSGRLSVPAVVLVAFVVCLSAFWSASEYAAALGRGRAQALAGSLSSRPAVTVFSKDRLALSGPGVVESSTGSGTAYRFKYAGLRLFIETGDRFFLLPEGWSRERGTVIMLHDSPTIRLEFGSGNE